MTYKEIQKHKPKDNDTAYLTWPKPEGYLVDPDSINNVGVVNYYQAVNDKDERVDLSVETYI